MSSPWIIRPPGRLAGTPLALVWRVFPLSFSLLDDANATSIAAFDSLFRNGRCEGSTDADDTDIASQDCVFFDSGSAFHGSSPRSILAMASGREGFSARFRATEGLTEADFYPVLREQLARIEVPTDFPRELTGGYSLGWSGIFGYELKKLAEDVHASPTRAATDRSGRDGAANNRSLGIGTPDSSSSASDAALLFADRALVFSPDDNCAVALAFAGDETWFTEVAAWFEEASIVVKTQSITATSGSDLPAAPRGDYRLDHGHDTYLANVRASQEHIAAGDTYEVCLTTTARGPALHDPFGTYRRLRATSPVPYGSYLQFPGAQSAGPDRWPIHVLSASPERFLRISQKKTRDRLSGFGRHDETTGCCHGNQPTPLIVETRPIKGTRPRGATVDEDAQLRAELQNSTKDRAENLMIVDLLRNDLAKVCAPGTVRVPRLFEVETYSHVHQLVSTVTGELDRGADAVNCLAACFPGGSMTGAPKVRTMELLEELEGRPRGLYSGAIGWLSPAGEADLAITIRTIVDDGSQSTFGIGGAIVTDSDAEGEWQEILVKASALLDALGATLD